MRSILAFTIACAFTLAGASPAGQQRADEKPRTDRLSLDTFLEMETVSDPQFSPDGSQVIYTRGWVDKMNDSRESALWIMNADGSRNRFLVKGSGARWSPNGDRIAYTATGEPRGSQIFVRWMDAEGATSQVTRVEQSPSGIAW
jgi:dipeptidyl aminopeptidase/acylaminoacyl peptidase